MKFKRCKNQTGEIVYLRKFPDLLYFSNIYRNAETHSPIQSQNVFAYTKPKHVRLYKGLYRRGHITSCNLYIYVL